MYEDCICLEQSYSYRWPFLEIVEESGHQCTIFEVAIWSEVFGLFVEDMILPTSLYVSVRPIFYTDSDQPKVAYLSGSDHGVLPFSRISRNTTFREKDINTDWLNKLNDLEKTPFPSPLDTVP